MKDAGSGGIVWTEQTLGQFLASPDTFVPNNVMASPGIKNPGDLKDLVAFLKLHK
jgi:cytochrome c